MKITNTLLFGHALSAGLFFFALVGANADEPQVIETTFADRAAVKTEVERVFALPSDASGVENLTLINPESESVLVLSSFGLGVMIMATIYERDDDEVVADRMEWHSSSAAPQYLVGTQVVILDSAKEADLIQELTSRNIEYEIEYLVNNNSAHEVAAYEKVLRAQIKKSEEPAGSQAIMAILDNVFDYDWNQATTKRVMIPPAY